MTASTNATAKVRLLVEVDVNSSWGKDCGVEQIHKQAADEAQGVIRQMYQKPDEYRNRVRIVGPPEVIAVIVKTER